LWLFISIATSASPHLSSPSPLGLIPFLEYSKLHYGVPSSKEMKHFTS
jgi:hypothetical protein